VEAIRTTTRDAEARRVRRDDLAEEIAHKRAQGGRQVTLEQLDAELRAIGYRLDCGGDCPSVNRYVSGPRAGRSYPAVNLRVVQASDGMSAMHIEARRDARFEALQQMRRTDALFAVHRGRLYEL
jgi:hypothetical protein